MPPMQKFTAIFRPNVITTGNLLSVRSIHSLVLGAAPNFVFTTDAMNSDMNGQVPEASQRKTDILPVDPAKLGEITVGGSNESLLDDWDIKYDESTLDTQHLMRAAAQLRETNIPVAFPTETVYGLGADARRSDAVKGIYKAKQRPSDNPLIVHIASLAQLRGLLRPNPKDGEDEKDPIPDIYKPLIQRFWPGPLSLIMPNPKDSQLAPEVTAGLDTFGARMPRSILALALIKLADVPLAGPSANASTKPSPTAAEHVKYDLDGRIDTIIDGGPCDIGVESTVVDGLSSPPAILRPGGISIEQLRECPGWEDVILAYKDAAAEDGYKPRAPGMKYRHYSPKAKVVLFEATAKQPTSEIITSYLGEQRSFGLIRTISWPAALGLEAQTTDKVPLSDGSNIGLTRPFIPVKLNNGTNLADLHATSQSSILSNLLKSFDQHRTPTTVRKSVKLPTEEIALWEVNLGSELEEIARGLFSAFRRLDQENVDVILVEGIADDLGSLAAAIMNRLRKAAVVITKE